MNQERIPNTRFNLYQIIKQLEDPPVRLDNNERYKVPVETLGRLYACAVSIVPANCSPGIMLAKETLYRPEVVLDFKKEFQRFTRRFLYICLGELIWRKSTATDLKRNYVEKDFPEKLEERSIEDTVKKMASQKEYELLGKRLKEGAQQYHEKMLQRGMHNYRYVAEYAAILEALQP